MSIDRLDVPAAQVAADMAALIARQRQQRLDEGLAAEYRHLLYDAAPDSTVPAFDYPQPGGAS
jgi:hypothetical protein